jgi:hypothetical protein
MGTPRWEAERAVPRGRRGGHTSRGVDIDVEVAIAKSFVGSNTHFSFSKLQHTYVRIDRTPPLLTKREKNTKRLKRLAPKRMARRTRRSSPPSLRLLFVFGRAARACVFTRRAHKKPFRLQLLPTHQTSRHAVNAPPPRQKRAHRKTATRPAAQSETA